MVLMNLLRKCIRNILIKEQVVGYEAPKEKEQDPEEYLSDGSVSAPAGQHSQEAETAADLNVRSLTKQRQSALDSGDNDTASELGRQIQDLVNKKNESILRNYLRTVLR